MSRIPKIIHYCWFGRKEKPKEVQKYIESWKSVLPDYQIIEWNEENFPIDYCDYARDAYKAGKYAFVSDVARLYALNEYGGIYFDTDIEILRTLDEYLEAAMILSFESSSIIMTAFFAAEPNCNIVASLLNEYKSRPFRLPDGNLNLIANSVYITEYLEKNGLIRNGREQRLSNDIYVYEHERFGAFNADTSEMDISDNTILVHHCMATWMKSSDRAMLSLKKILAKVFGKYYQQVREMVRKRR